MAPQPGVTFPTRRFIAKALLIIALSVLVFALPASAAKPQPTPLVIDNAYAGGQLTSWIEQQDDWPKPVDFIRNSVSGGFANPCVWSVNDHLDWQAGGYLDAGASTSRAMCVVSDFNPVYATRFGTTGWWSMAPYGFFGVSISDPALAVSVCYQPQNRCFTPNTSFCGRANYGPDDPALSDIVDSHGGEGIITTVRLTISNPTSRRIRNISIRWGFSSDVVFPAGCGGQIAQTDYPFTWAED